MTDVHEIRRKNLIELISILLWEENGMTEPLIKLKTNLNRQALKPQELWERRLREKLK